jgi:hypothetical protein
MTHPEESADKPASASDEQPAASRRRPSGARADGPAKSPDTVEPKPARVLFIDYQLAETPPHQTAPHGLGMSLMLHPGINLVDAEVWASVEHYPGVPKLIELSQIRVLETLHRRELEDMAERTWSAAGLDAIEQAEKALYGDKPRAVVMRALELQRARVAKGRSKPAPRVKEQPAPVRKATRRELRRRR